MKCTLKYCNCSWDSVASPEIVVVDCPWNSWICTWLEIRLLSGFCWMNWKQKMTIEFIELINGWFIKWKNIKYHTETTFEFTCNCSSSTITSSSSSEDREILFISSWSNILLFDSFLSYNIRNKIIILQHMYRYGFKWD